MHSSINYVLISKQIGTMYLNGMKRINRNGITLDIVHGRERNAWHMRREVNLVDDI